MVYLRLAILIQFFSTIFSQVIPQPDDIDSGNYDDLFHNNSQLCTRTCKEGEPPRTCYYKFNLEPYVTMGRACGGCPSVAEDCFKPQCVTGNGFEKAILTVNRRLPGPSIQVCKGDTIVADVKNLMPGMSTTIHWHGVRQKLTPWMDGVPMVTQCPILEGQTFRYRFLVDEAGTYFWHSHDGLQKVDGIVSSLIVREPDSENALRSHYDFDLPSHTFVVQDWMHTSSGERLPGIQHRFIGQSADSYIINGRGSNLRSLYDLYGPKKPPLTVFKVQAGLRYRFRVVSGSCLSCQFRLSIQKHKLKIITIDDNPIEPVVVDTLVMSAGERYDFVLETNQEVASYWLVVKGLGACVAASQAAILRYFNASTPRPRSPEWTALLADPLGFTINGVTPCTNESRSRGLCISQLNSLMPTPAALLKPKPDLRLTLAFGFHDFTDQELFQSGTYSKFFVPAANIQLQATINNVSNIMAPSPFLYQLEDIPPTLLCDQCPLGRNHCECLHVIKIPLNSVVEIIIADTSSPLTSIQIRHPFHIHGMDFYVLEQGVWQGEWRGALARLRQSPPRLRPLLPIKDTVTIPSAGYAVVRILADNPGFWFYHCHFAYHLENGMTAVLQVGEPSEMRKPPADFPRCKQYLPPIEVEDNNIS